jgi:hypothetical protein
MRIVAGRWVLALTAMTGSSMAMGQDLSKSAPVDVAVTYDALRSSQVTGDSLWLQSGAVELGARFYRGLGIAARVEGSHAASSSGREPLNLLTTIFGLRYSMTSHSGRYVVFGEGLAGETNAFHTLFSVGSGPAGSPNAGTTTSANALAVETGGGLDIRLSHRLAVRAIRASYLRTQFPNSSTNVQNNLALGAGIVFRMGR